ncbi:glutamyl-tRNA synthetase [Nematocida sp. AWRm77]|nr:glutamyl-tRNA synthetase [Nematocida sp. AWRm77]
MKVVCNYRKRESIIPHVVSKHFAGVEVEESAEESKGFFNYDSLLGFLQGIPEWNCLERMPFLKSWGVKLKYPELMGALSRMEESNLAELKEKERALLFSLLYAETVFVNLYKNGKLSAYPKVVQFYNEASVQEEESLRECERLKKIGDKSASQTSFDIGLAPGYKVVTRFPPEPSGYLHIGHAKAALLNQYFAEKYHGQLIVRMDDTNPTNEKEEFEQSILADLALLGITEYRTTRTSDYFEELFSLAKTLIEKGQAYCDDTPVEEMRNNRDKGIPSPRRDTAPEENLAIFGKMAEGPTCDQYCVRAKISIDDPNKAMRDPVIYRVNTAPHHYTGTKYRVYPTYDFACPVVDSVEGITLTLRTNEYRDRNPQYMWFISALGLENRPTIWDFSRMNFQRTVLSKRKLRWFVEHKKVAGWDDPRMPTIRGVLRKGLCKEALRAYIISQGPSRHTVLLSWDKIWALNAHMIDARAKRVHGIESSDLVQVHVQGAAERVVQMEGREDRVFTPDVYVSQKDLGTPAIGDEFVLMGAFGCRVTGLSPITAEETQTPPRQIAKKVTWVSSTKNAKIQAMEYRDLITVDKPEDQEPHELFNPNSVHQSEMVCDERVLAVKQKEFIQIEKRGFFYCDSVSPLVFNLVPGTKQNLH